MNNKNTIIKNIAKGTFDEVYIEDGVFILLGRNEEDQTIQLSHDIDKSYIQFHFCVKGNSNFMFNNGAYEMTISAENSLLLYNPEKKLPISIALEPSSASVSLLISINKIHGLFSSDANYVTFLTDENKNKKYYKDSNITASMMVVLSQLINFNLNPSVRPLYFKAKAYELLSIFFNKNEGIDTEQCPYLEDEVNVAKLKKAKDIIISNMAEPPTLKELSEHIDLSLKKLKEGFKQIYGDTVYGFLFDYKMEVARNLLVSGSYNVNEVGLKVGYSTSSHFISAFKKKFGTTPKKYIQSTT